MKVALSGISDQVNKDSKKVINLDDQVHADDISWSIECGDILIWRLLIGLNLSENVTLVDEMLLLAYNGRI